MKVKVNFEEYPLYYFDEGKETPVICDIRLGLSDKMFRCVIGIDAHVLSEKIYKSKGEIELDEAECAIVHKTLLLFNDASAENWNDYVLKHREE